jgi:pyruvate ferredoxin oxidoreductase gamma subunit
MIEIAIHGRGGQGAVTASQILAMAFEEQGIRAQAFPQFGTERTGSPVQSFVRASRKEIKTKSPVTLADYSLVIDPTLIGTVKIVEGTKPRGTIIINTKKDFSGISRMHHLISIDVKQVASEIFARGVNVGLLGAFVGSTRVLQIKSLSAAISTRFPRYVEENQKVAEKVYEVVRKELM